MNQKPDRLGHFVKTTKPKLQQDFLFWERLQEIVLSRPVKRIGYDLSRKYEQNRK